MKKKTFLTMLALLLSIIGGCRGNTAEDFVSEVKGELKFGMSLADTYKKVGDIGDPTKMGRYHIYLKESSVYNVPGFIYYIFDSKGGLCGISFSYKPDKVLGTQSYSSLKAHFIDRLPVIEGVYGDPISESKSSNSYVWEAVVDSKEARIVYKYPLKEQEKFESVYLVGAMFEKEAFENVGEAIGAGAD
jgi:hypothetical protein